jgi:hypothetical protein
MMTPDLLSICGSAFLGVFLLLALLAVIMRVIITLFPAGDDVSDAAVLAAMTATIGTLYPGTKITKVEEVK